MKILHLPTYTGGHAWRLAQAEKNLGLDSEVLYRKNEWLNYPCDINLELDKTSSALSQLTKLMSTFLQIRNKYDIFHFNFGSSLLHSSTYQLNQLDLPFYPKKAKLFVTYNGCDIRQKYPTMLRTKIAACHNYNCYNGQCNSGKLDEFRRKGIEKMQRYVKHIWALNPDLLYFLPPEKSSFLPYITDLKHLEILPPKLDKKIIIVHAPTNQEAKGSQYILMAIQKIEQQYPNIIELKLVENIPHQQALKIYQQADLIIDQILVGWYGGLAVETMQMGKPVVARIAEEDLHFLPQEMKKDVLETIINANPDTIYNVLCKFIENRMMLKQYSQASLEYVNKWHSYKYVVGLTKERYEIT
ncbi:glycosyltransferase [Cuspidothrix issatschenkoi LEGE 03284]|uniref:glycosyltransferase n=1 Tax=Cuspidothrix issatschenkoi TaxID=230752 RepID=UPI001880839B|nr:glycosyltransferase [Cuspidothrix issatschenkoi]MBE9234273.1 glycosyltransferase [Cuspidothrix issatschenkoi LEGE 03284]